MSGIPGRINFLNFEVLKEPWNEYKLEDGTTLRVKVVLSGLIKDGDMTFSLPHTSVFSVMPDPKFIRTPSLPLKSGEKLESFIEAEDLKILSQTDNWNEYEIPSEHMKLIFKGALVSVSRTSRNDEKGIPVYVTNVQLLVKHKKGTK